MAARNNILAGVCLFFLASLADRAQGANGPLVQPLEGWLIGVLVVVLISMLSQHRPVRFGQDRTKPARRWDTDQA